MRGLQCEHKSGNFMLQNRKNSKIGVFDVEVIFFVAKFRITSSAT